LFKKILIANRGEIACARCACHPICRNIRCAAVFASICDEYLVEHF